MNGSPFNDPAERSEDEDELILLKVAFRTFIFEDGSNNGAFHSRRKKKFLKLEFISLLRGSFKRDFKCLSIFARILS